MAGRGLFSGWGWGLAATHDAPRSAPPHLTAAAARVPRRQVGPLSVLSDQSTLQTIVWSDLTKNPNLVLDRGAAMGVPAVARQRHLLCGTLARCPLVVVDKATGNPLPDERQPGWATRTDRLASPYHRMLWTSDDTLFHGWSLWRTERGYAGELLAVEHLPVERWETDEVGRIIIDGDHIATEGEVIAIPGPHEGILHFGRRALQRTIANLDAAHTASMNPSAYLELHYTGDDPLTDDDIDAIVARWAAARRGENGGVAWTGKFLELKEHGSHEAQLLIDGRNADAVDVSRMVSSPAAMADATAAGASLTYETTEGRNSQFIDYGVGLYMDAIAARLSQDDVTPRGTRVVFDTTELRTLAPSPYDTDTAPAPDPAAGGAGPAATPTTGGTADA